MSNGAHTDYAYKADGFLTSLSNQTAATTTNTVNPTAYIRDRLGNMPTQVEATATTHRYNELFRLLNADASGTANDERFTYDEIGNRQHRTNNGAVQRFLYDADNRFTEIHQMNAAGASLSDFVCGANGNLTRRCSGGMVTRTATTCSDARGRNDYLKVESQERSYRTNGIQACYLRGVVIDEVVNSYRLAEKNRIDAE